MAPGGQSYLTRPGSRLLFRSLCEPTAAVVASTAAGESAPNPGLMMLRRNRTRTQDRNDRIDDERRLNEGAGLRC
jgi:hypothetical protein